MPVSKETKERLELATRYFNEMLARVRAAQTDLEDAGMKLRHSQNAWEREFLGEIKLEREECAKVADDYARDGRMEREYACEVADELAARIRNRTNTN